MAVAAIKPQSATSMSLDPDRRAAPRFHSLMRAAKLVGAQGEFVCVVRDVSSRGVRLRCFHTLPSEPRMTLELQSGEAIVIERVRGEGFEASFRFTTEVPIERLISDGQFYPRRPLRLAIKLPVTLRTQNGPIAAITSNLSQQGCRLESAYPLAMAQPVVVEAPRLPGIRAKVRWRQDRECGLVFDDTFSLRDFAVHVARLQCPALTV